jgi:predicted  nucleic acid-binding Zn-ribbon protein
MNKSYRELEEKRSALENNLKEAEINLRMYQDQSVHNTSFISSTRKQLRMLSSGQQKQRGVRKEQEKYLINEQQHEIEQEEEQTVQRYQYQTY